MFTRLATSRRHLSFRIRRSGGVPSPRRYAYEAPAKTNRIKPRFDLTVLRTVCYEYARFGFFHISFSPCGTQESSACGRTAPATDEPVMSFTMRVLHLFSNYKWTGPSEPVVNLIRALRDTGLDVRFACQKTPKPRARSVQDKAAQYGLEPIMDFRLTNLLSFDTLRDIRRLSAYLAEHNIDIVHTHRPQDHAVGGHAARRSSRRVLVVRTNHTGVPLKKS